MQRHLLEFGRSILLQATPKTCPFSGRPYVEDVKIQGVKILLMGIGKAPSIGARGQLKADLS